VEVKVAEALVPAMKVKPNPDKPFEARLANAAVPWTRGSGEFTVVTITAAVMPPMKALEK
jgi:hypothetical protein